MLLIRKQNKFLTTLFVFRLTNRISHFQINEPSECHKMFGLTNPTTLSDYYSNKHGICVFRIRKNEPSEYKYIHLSGIIIPDSFWNNNHHAKKLTMSNWETDFLPQNFPWCRLYISFLNYPSPSTARLKNKQTKQNIKLQFVT